jgi:hypothetical protein
MSMTNNENEKHMTPFRSDSIHFGLHQSPGSMRDIFVPTATPQFKLIADVRVENLSCPEVKVEM